MSMLGMWRGWWDSATYFLGGEDRTMRLAAEWLDGACADVEDWGCGSAHARQFFKAARYVGVDGSGPKADVIADLEEHVSAVDGVLLRHVLEHNYGWRKVLLNALMSARKRIAIVLFTPYAEGVTKELRWNAMRADEAVGVPDLALSRTELFEVIGEHGWDVTSEESYDSETVYGKEVVLKLQKDIEWVGVPVMDKP